MRTKSLMRKKLDKKIGFLKKVLLKLKLPNLITILLLLLIWLHKERQDTDDQLDDLLEESKFLNFFRSFKTKAIYFLTFFLIPVLVIVYNLVDSNLFEHYNFVVNFFSNVYKYFSSNNEDELERLDQEDEERLYRKYGLTIEKMPFEIENLRVELKKELKQLRTTVDSLNKDKEQSHLNQNKIEAKNDLKLERFEKKLIEIINDELSKVKDVLLDKINSFQQKYSFLDVSNKDKFYEMFETAEVAVDLIRRRDQQLKDLFKITTEIRLKNELVDDDLKNVKQAYVDLVEVIKSNNQDLAKYIEDIKQVTEDSLSNKFKNDQIRLFNEVENFRTEIDIKDKDFSKLISLFNNLELSLDSTKKQFSEYDNKIRQCLKEVDELRDVTMNLDSYLNTDITGKINGILKFLGKSELEDK